MKRTVAEVIEGFTNTGRFPYALAKLDCGHLVGVETRPNRGQCCHCSREADLPTGTTTVCACGRSSFTILKPYPNPHVESDRLTKVGQVIECAACDKEAEQLEWLKALDPASVHHSRMDRHGWKTIHLYRHDQASPSGFFLIGSVAANQANEEQLSKMRRGPLSPTEPA